MIEIFSENEKKKPVHHASPAQQSQFILSHISMMGITGCRMYSTPSRSNRSFISRALLTKRRSKRPTTDTDVPQIASPTANT
jgi:hypothetical protein